MYGVAIPVTTPPKNPPGQPEDLAALMRDTHRAVSGLCADYLIDREDRKAETVKTHAMLRQVGARLQTIEVRLSALEERMGATESALMGEYMVEDEDEG